MKTRILVAMMTAVMAFSSQAFADCTLIKENDRTIVRQGDCSKRASPCSTFKIAISLMGYDSHILIDETHPEWPYKPEYNASMPIWKQPHNPTSWIAHSCVWYSQIITRDLGEARFKEYAERLHYGNEDVSGDKGQYNGLMRAWLSSSIRISPDEQVDFLQKLIASKLPVSQEAQRHTRNILSIGPLADGWQLYGKTGSGHQDGYPDRQLGWFVGWVEKGGRHIAFAHYIEDTKHEATYGGPRAKAQLLAELQKLLP